MKTPPIPTYRRELKNLEGVYKAALTKLTTQLTNIDPTDLARREVYESQIRQIAFIMNELNAESKAWVEATLTEAFSHSQASALVSLGLANDIVEAKGKLQFSLMSRQRIEAMIDDTFDDILKAHSKMSADLKKLVREVQGEVLRLQVATQRGTVDSAKELRKSLLAQGFSKSLVEENWKGIVDAGGNRWDLTTYTNMVARTKLQQVQLEGARIQALENDTDLAMISSHGAKDSCSRFEGIIISLEGRTRGYMTLAEVRASGLIFHPNCQHSVHPIGDIDALPEKLRKRAEEQQARAEEALSDPQRLKREDGKRRYQEKKEKKQRIKEQRRKALEKAREQRAKNRNS